MQFAKTNKLDFSVFALLTPYPGTRLSNKMEAEKRIMTKNWDDYTADYALITHPKIKGKDMLDEMNNVFDEFYKPSYILKRSSYLREKGKKFRHIFLGIMIGFLIKRIFSKNTFYFNWNKKI